MFQINLSTITEVMPQKLWEVEEVKNYLRVSSNHDDRLISKIIDAAITAAENFTGLTLLLKRIKYHCNIKNIKKFYLQYKPATDIIRIAFIKDAREQELTPKQYSIDRQRWCIHLAKTLINEELMMEYIAGFRPELIPPSIKQGILLHVAEMYDRQQTNTNGLSIEVRNLYLSYRQLRI